MTPTRHITRSKTGCFTCRKRRKKCDEGRPDCRNCLRNKLICEGYQPKTRWRPVQTVADAVSEGAISNTGSSQSWPTKTSPGALAQCDVRRASPTTENIPMTCNPSWIDSFPFESSRVGDDPPAGQQSAPSPAAIGSTGSGPKADGQLANGVDLVASGLLCEQSLQIQGMQGLSVISQPLPCLVDGVQSPMERKVFYHYRHVVTDILLLKTAQNPFVTMLIPRALSDRDGGLLDAIIALSASQCQRSLSATGHGEHSAERVHLEHLKWKRHGKAVRRQIQLLNDLNCTSSLASQAPTPNTRQLLTLTMILYEFSICEGDPDLQSARQMHLCAARELVRQIYGDGHYDPLKCDEFDSFVLELFYFHDVCSSLTSQRVTPCINLHAQTVSGFATISPAALLAQVVREVGCSTRQVRLLGLHDGLFASLARVIDLRRRYARIDSDAVSAELFLEGLEIEAELRSWHYDYGDRSKSLVAESYRLAVFIILWFTMYPDSSLDAEKIQRTVRQGVLLMSGIEGNDNAQTCALLPLFIFGVSASTPEHRELVEAKIQSYAAWACLANIEECLAFLQQYWQSEHDMSQSRRKWWDWEHELQSCGADICPV